MKITSVKVRVTDNEDSKMRGIATVVLDDCFAIHDIRIIDGAKGLFMAMPSRKTPTGEYRDIAHPMSSECRDMFTKAILDAYEEELKNKENV